MEPAHYQEILDVRDRHESWLKTLPGFVGSSAALSPSGEVALKIMSDRMPDDAKQAVAERLGEVRFFFEELPGGVRLQRG
jgi:hypothetical protein